MIRFFFFLLGFGFSVIGMMYAILYLNLLTMGYSFLEYIKFIFTKIECLFGLIGFIVVTITIFYKGGKKYDLYL